MNSSICGGLLNSSQCLSYCNNEFHKILQKQLEEPMPWIGLYIATSSAVCSLAMAADVFNGFRSKMYWLPCKYFSLNATTLTLLAVAMKLPMDLTKDMLGNNDKVAKLSSLVLMSISMGNFMTSLGSMENNEILMNLTALCVLVVTIIGNVCINILQFRNFVIGPEIWTEEFASTVFLLLFLVVLGSSAIMVPTGKKCIESKYYEIHKTISNEHVLAERKFTSDELRAVVKKYWMMAETGSLQFVMARSVICATSGLMCLFMAADLVAAQIRNYVMYIDDDRTDYKWSIIWILVIQNVGVAVGTIAPVSRWFTAIRFKCSNIGHKTSFKDEFKIENYWTERLEQWRKSSIPLPILKSKSLKLLHAAKGFLLNFFLKLQILIVLSSKLVVYISAILLSTVISCFNRIKISEIYSFSASNEENKVESVADTELDLSCYVLLLEGEAELPQKTLANICNEVDKLVQKGKRQQPKNLIGLLLKSHSFNGIREFDISEVPSLHSKEPPNCWALPLVTLTAIAIAIPNITSNKVKQLLREVKEGLSFANLVDKTLDTNGEFLSIRNAADVTWVDVELYKKWQDNDLQKASPSDRPYRDKLQELADIAKNTVADFKTNTTDFLTENPLNWPEKVIAANSMYRISDTILRLMAERGSNYQTDEGMFEQLTVIISDILAACLTNLGHVITMKCYSHAIKEREKSLREAAVLLGETEEILEVLQNHELPGLDMDKAAQIEEWRAFMEQKFENVSYISSSGNETVISQSREEQVSIELDC